jgi:serine/threonine protein kinase
MASPGDPADLRDKPRGANGRPESEGADRRIPFGKYLLLGKIARGGMAEIYRAIPAAGPPQLLAIKCMRSHLAKESRFVEMFIREGKLAMMLDHPSIVRTFDVGSVDGRYFITMEYLSGQDLNTILRRCQETSRRVPVPHAIYVALCVCRALHYAHTLANSRGEPLNIVNRDVSPSNVRISYTGDVKLLDFGIAQAVLQVSSEIGVLKGKFSYMSPEQVRGLPVDRRTDIFSSGIVLHEMLACERLFKDESEFVLMEKVRRADVRPPSAFNKRVPPPLDAIVSRALQREPEARYPDSEAMAHDLERLLEGYRFTRDELGEFVRGLFPNDYREAVESEQICLSGGTVEEAPEEPEAQEEEPSEVKRTVRPRRARRRGRRVSRRRKRAAQRRAAVLLVCAAALLFAAIVILMVALL